MAELGAASPGPGPLVTDSSSDGVVERFLGALVRHDWDALADCLTDDVTRVGPYGDTYARKAEYLAFLTAVMPSLPGYAMDVSRITYGDGVAYAELTETVGSEDDEPLRTPECLSFTLAADGRIRRIEVFIQTPPER